MLIDPAALSDAWPFDASEAASRPGAPVSIAGASITREDLRDRVERLSARIAGVPTIAVVAHPSLEAVVAVLAGISAGSTVVPISPDAGPRERDHVLVDAKPALVLDGHTVSERPDGGAGAADREAATAPRPALVLYTSGTTGPPKGVPITAAAITACLSGLADAWAWTPDDTLVHGLPLHHVHGLVLGVLGPLAIGCGLVHTGRPTPTAYAGAGGTLYFGVPTVWSRIAADPTAARALAPARLLVSGSAGLPAPVFDAIADLTGQAPVERYGMTETLITLAARADEPRVRGSVGRPVGDIEIRLRDDDGRPVPVGDLGTVEVRGATVFAGYLGRPDATAEVMSADGWFRTGDVAQQGADGTYRIVGRASTDLIKSGGYRIGAGEVEDVLLAHPAVVEAAVVGEPDDDLGQAIVAYVVLAPGAGVGPEDLTGHVATELSWHKRPRRVVITQALPRNAMGKVDKRRLRDG